MCKFFVHKLECPDSFEFGDCAYQHDELILKAHRVKELNENNLEVEVLAKITEEMILEDTEDEEVIQYRRTLLRIWPDPPTDEAKEKARLQIKNYKEKLQFQKEA